MEIHYITNENYEEAYDAIRDILYLYDDMVTSYSRFGHNLNLGNFDPFRYLSSLLDEAPGYTFGIDLDLIHQGSSVALLCHLSDYWDDFEGEEIGGKGITKKIKLSLDDGMFDNLPLAKSAVSSAFESLDKFDSNLSKVYDEYVVGYYKARLNEGITSH